jgi:hypothetical protein
MAGFQIYDIHTDEYRPITQADVDELLAFRKAYSAMRTAFNDVHNDLLDTIKEAKQRIAPSDDDGMVPPL